MIKVFIVVLNWNQPDLTVECVKSLEKLSIPKGCDVKTIIVDNGSTDNSVEKFRKLPSVTVIEAGKNFGFAGGNNIGIRYAIDYKADFVMILNNDTEVDKMLLVNLLDFLTKNKKTAITSPKIYFAKGYEFHKKYSKNQLGKVLWYAGGKIDWNNIYGENIGVDQVDKKQFDKTKQIDFATGACFLARITALKEVGLFDEKYFMYKEDEDLCVRLAKKDWKIFYVPGAKLWHKVAQSSAIGSDLNDYFIARNRLLFGFKYAKPRTKLALIKESLKLFILGRHWQAVGVRDFYFRKFGKGSWE